MKDFKITYLGENLLLHPFKSLYWERKKILLLADVHLGKAAHFRKSGIPIPEVIHQSDFDRIEGLINIYRPERLIVLGDLFHSSYNNSWQTFKKFCSGKIKLVPELVLGNHDVLEENQYDFLIVHKDKIVLNPFVLSHKPLETDRLNEYYNLCGHIHPSVRITGYARQSIRVECFYFGKNHGILPAFGSFTGTSKMPKRNKTDKIYAITNQKIIHLF
ncbi:MAG: ligase-associated DNA damage response endonuclease PdeM [Cytophagales bacterium]|nr:ligase-associated DNA damage response endonuclease PdeM [Cytophagales bacterium]